MKSLQPYNSFGIKARCRDLLFIESMDDLTLFLQSNNEPFIILGGGSNVLFTQDYEGTILINHLQGIEVKRWDDRQVLVSAGGGVVWDDLVNFTVDKAYHGIENLTAIPGSVGAAPMQNIGAYGVELKDVFHSLKAIHLKTGNIEVFDRTDCQFGYRSSIFKTVLKNEYFIVEVSILLSRNTQIIDTYTPVKEALIQKGINDPCIKDMRDIIRDIRWSKLPKPEILGNAGSFFKNPVISKIQMDKCILTHSEMPHYKVENGIKVPAAWLIDQCGWKGVKKNNTGSHKTQPLVLVNYGGANGVDVLHLAQEIQDSVLNRFGISLEMEVNIY